MQDERRVEVLRLGHRPGRDERMTTHVGLTARALGADGVVLAGAGASRAPTIEDITDRFGGPFDVETTDSPRAYIRDWEGTVAHLTMYGLLLQDVEPDLKAAHGDESVLLVVGAEKVPFDVYEEADYNVAVTNQPHSEVASLAVTLDRLFEGRELEREWIDADRVVRPQETGKRVEAIDGENVDGEGDDSTGER